MLLKSPYGRRGMAPNIAGDTDLEFEITLLDVDGTDACDIADPLLYSQEQRLDIVKKLSKQANEMVSQKYDYAQALQLYQKALGIVEAER